MSSNPTLPVLELASTELLGASNEALRRLAPPVIYAQGDLGVLASGARVAVLGSRRPTLPAIKRAVRFVEELEAEGVVVVSGMSEGIHTAVHGSALDCGARSIAVLATGHGQFFPKISEYLQRTLAARGLVLSSLPRELMASRDTYAKRDELIALVADAVVVVEAQPESGTLATARTVLRAGRPLFLMASILDDSRMEWPKALMAQGAQVLAEAGQVFEILPERGANSSED